MTTFRQELYASLGYPELAYPGNETSETVREEVPVTPAEPVPSQEPSASNEAPSYVVNPVPKNAPEVKVKPVTSKAPQPEKSIDDLVQPTPTDNLTEQSKPATPIKLTTEIKPNYTVTEQSTDSTTTPNLDGVVNGHSSGNKSNTNSKPVPNIASKKSVNTHSDLYNVKGNFHRHEEYGCWARGVESTDKTGRYIEINLTPMFENGWATKVEPIIIRSYNCWTGRRGGFQNNLPAKVVDAMVNNLGEPLTRRLLTEDFYSQINWGEYNKRKIGVADKFEDIKKR